MPEVDTDDLKAVWRVCEEIQKENPGQQVGIGGDALRHVCKPGANMNAVWYRSMHLNALKLLAGLQRSPEPEMAEVQEKIAAVLKDGVTDATFNATAKIPMTWEMRGLPFDFDEFLRLCA